MGVESVIRDNAVALTRTRRVATINAEGYGQDADTPVAITGVMQPMSAKELKNVPEGQRTQEWRNIWSESELQNRDLITDPEGNQFTIQSAEYWREGTFYKATATRVSDNGAVS